LATTLYTRNIVKADKYACKLKAQIVAVDAYFGGEISTPFGGLKASGFSGRDNSIHAHQESTDAKTIWFDLCRIALLSGRATSAD